MLLITAPILFTLDERSTYNINEGAYQNTCDYAHDHHSIQT